MRFSDEVLQAAMDAFTEARWALPRTEGYAAMRAVLEGHPCECSLALVQALNAARSQVTRLEREPAMSERFSDEVLQRAYFAADDAYRHPIAQPRFSVGAMVAAMRAVLEGHLAAQDRLNPAIPREGLPNIFDPHPEDTIRHDSIKPTSGRLLSAKKVKKASDGRPR